MHTCKIFQRPERASSPRRGLRALSFRGIAKTSFLTLALLAWADTGRAADLPRAIEPPSPALAPPPPAEFNWSGFYVGAHGGMGFDHFAFKYAIDVPGAAFTGTDGIDGFGPVLGLQAGFNYQIPIGFFRGGLVIGVELDNSWTGIYGTTTGTGVPPTNLGAATFGGRFLNYGTGRLRIGYALDRLLLYVTGGFAYGITKTYYNLTTTAGFQSAGVSTDVRSGVPGYVGALGVGAEYAINNNWTVRAEYFYVGINAHFEVFNPAEGASVGFGTRTMYHIGRIGLNYKFDWAAPQPAPLSSLF